MPDRTPEILDDLDARGLIHDSTDRSALAARLRDGITTLYYGCDPSADSLHIGNLIGLLILRRFQLAGHRPIALAGGATGMVGDPSGRSDERNLLDSDTVVLNVARIKDQITRVLGAEGEWELVDNLTWTAQVGLLDFLRDVGKHVTVNQMLARESVKARMEGEHGISYTEFSYMLLQANDFLWLHDHKGCELQIGGSDQWGNILSGVDLIRRSRQRSVHALCWPLLTASDGSKVGKTTGARVWLAADRTSPFELYQHFLHTPDDEVGRYLAWFTLLPVPDVDRLVAEHGEAPHERRAQRALAAAVTELLHGAETAGEAEAQSAQLFSRELEGEPPEVLESLAQEGAADVVFAPDGLATVLVGVDLAQSKSEARRLLEQRGIRVNGRTLASSAALTPDDLLHGRYLVLRRGKQRVAVVRVDVADQRP
jgi:tyrosyl-tRNA synthetase